MMIGPLHRLRVAQQVTMWQGFQPKPLMNKMATINLMARCLMAKRATPGRIHFHKGNESDKQGEKRNMKKIWRNFFVLISSRGKVAQVFCGGFCGLLCFCRLVVSIYKHDHVVSKNKFSQ
mmetsp:Transcript_27038/g.62858  ORF Transcript_27038/g.62858 Transcript_27038/m.62858 type:complete len:120 (-) Transcript_27038:19-378(-)